MSEEQMRRALGLLTAAEKLHRQFHDYVLLKRDAYQGAAGETISVGDPVRFREGEYHRVSVPIPEDARRYVFGLWQRQIARQFNDAVRELNQLGVKHSFRLISFNEATGAPRP